MAWLGNKILGCIHQYEETNEILCQLELSLHRDTSDCKVQMATVADTCVFTHFVAVSL